MYTSLKISKLIQERVPEVEGDYVLYRNKTPAYTLADVIRAIKVYFRCRVKTCKGEKDGECEHRVVYIKGFIASYLPMLSLQSEEVETVLLSIFK